MYYSLATSLYNGTGYRLLYEPGSPLAVVWPPVLPLLVATHQFVLGTVDPVVVGTALRVSSLALWILWLLAVYVLLRQRLAAEYALVATLGCGLHQSPVWLSDRLNSDLPFALFVALFLLSSMRQSRPATVTQWLSATIAYGLRSAGLPLFIAWVTEAALRRRGRQFTMRLILAAVPLLAWRGYVAAVEDHPSYNQPAYAYARAPYQIYNVGNEHSLRLRDPYFPERGSETSLGLVKRILYNGLNVVPAMGVMLSAKRDDWTSLVDDWKKHPLTQWFPWIGIDVYLWLAGGIVGAGLLLMLVDGELLIVSVVAAYTLIACLLPNTFHWPRVFVALMPIFWIAAHRSWRFAAAASASPWYQMWAHAALVLAIAGNGLVQVQVLNWYFQRDFQSVHHRNWAGHRVPYRLFTYRRESQELDDALDHINTRPQGKPMLMVSSVPGWVWLRTGIPSVLPAMEHDRLTARRLLDDVGATSVLIDRGWSVTREYTLPLVEEAKAQWAVTFRAAPGGAQLYERVQATVAP